MAIPTTMAVNINTCGSGLEYTPEHSLAEQIGGCALYIFPKLI